MGIAMMTLQGLIAPLHDLVSWFAGPQPARLTAPVAVPQRVPLARPGWRSATTEAGRSLRAHRAQRPARPLRVLRVVDGGHSTAHAGRMLISGRMADVCAELDRLAAAEQTLH